MTTQPSLVVLAGNPRPQSRTLAAAQVTADVLSGYLGVTGPRSTVDLAELAPEVFATNHPRVDEALRVVASAGVLVVATPVYKGSYTGLLKSFLDLYGPGALAGVTAVPLVVSASPAHSSAGNLHLLPLLVELGARVPDRSIALLEPRLAHVTEEVVAWWPESGLGSGAGVRPQAVPA